MVEVEEGERMEQKSKPRVIALVDDLFFQARLLETARQVGVELRVAGTGKALVAEAQQDTALILMDLNARGGPLEALEELRARGNPAPVIGFLSHVQTEMAERARAAGCSQVLPRSKFTANLAQILSAARGAGGESG